MLIRKKRGWEIPERDVTPESVVLNRRQILRGLGLAAAGAGGLYAAAEVAGGVQLQQQVPATPYPEAVKYPSGPAADLYPASAHSVLTAADAGRPMTPPELAHAYNNFYEFFTPKQEAWRHVGNFVTEPWTVEISGKVGKPGKYDLEDLMRKMPMEERVTRHRCVERWAAVIPWTGFPLRALVDFVEPEADAKFVAMTTVYRPDQMPGIKGQSWYPWPYFEGLTIEEARNELAFLSTGSYGKPQPKQNGAPIRLVTPWKFGFKQIKSIVKFEFTDKQPGTFWSKSQGNEYGFWANVNPEVPHPRWSQSYEWLINTGDVYPTALYNGYQEWVADLYTGMERKLGAWLYR